MYMVIQLLFAVHLDTFSIEFEKIYFYNSLFKEKKNMFPHNR
jgi:hypothetical protein